MLHNRSGSLDRIRYYATLRFMAEMILNGRGKMRDRPLAAVAGVSGVPCKLNHWPPRVGEWVLRCYPRTETPLPQLRASSSWRGFDIADFFLTSLEFAASFSKTDSDAAKGESVLHSAGVRYVATQGNT